MDRSLSERDICSKFITPALGRAGWDLHAQVREEVSLTNGRVIVRGKLVARGKPKRADYVLYLRPGVPIAVVEAKDGSHGVGDGMQQALGYGEMLDVPFVYSSNGSGFLEHDRTGMAVVVERPLSLDSFPSPEDLWRRYCEAKGLSAEAEAVVSQEYHVDSGGKTPRYYQSIAINRAVEAIAKGEKRVLLVMATGCGKTATAFQIIWRLWKSRAKKRILFLADRNILVDQTKTNDFKPFGNAMTKIANRKVDKSYEIYLALYQAISGTDESRDIFKEFSPDFFDLIVVDECHRGSASENSAWREILDYFSSATQLGLTATPKETEDVSTTHYFGDALYTYTLKQGIADGFLAPYKVLRVDLDKDLEGWRPTQGQLDDNGREIEDRIYNQSDIDRHIVFTQRDRSVARRITEFLRATDRMAKTIVFCEDIDHAERMRQALVNENADLCAQDRRYVMRITGDNPEGKAELDNFIHPEKPFPVVVTTSKLMTTGVDCQTCKVVVLDQTIRSVAEFKQIVGRGTRIREDFNKLYFTIVDFKRATELFSDKDFDGTPERIYEVSPEAPIDEALMADDGSSPRTPQEGFEGEVAEEEALAVQEAQDGPLEAGERRQKYVVSGVPFYVLKERVQYYGKDGKLVTESLRDFVRETVQEEFKSLDDFLKRWNEAERKAAIVAELQEHGLLLDAVAEEVGRDYSAFDLICHVAYGQPPLTRRERANNVRKRNYFTRYGEQARAVLETLLAKYADEGVEDIDDMNVLRVKPLDQLGTPVEILRLFGGKDAYRKAVRELEAELYRAS